MTMWSTTGFSIQHQSLINQTSNENYGNHALEDADLIYMYQQVLRTVMSTEMKDSEGELTIWTLKMMKDTMSLKIYLLLCKTKKTSDNQLSNFAWPGQVLVYWFSYLVGGPLAWGRGHWASDSEK